MIPRMNIGCGPVRPPDWWNVDSSFHNIGMPGGGAFVLNRYDLDVNGWPTSGCTAILDVLHGIPMADDVLDGAVAHHVLQMIAWPQLVPWLSEVRRVLKPGAWLRITVPDMLGAIAAHKRRNRAWFPVEAESIDEALCIYLSQNGATRSLFTGWSLHELCQRAGFSEVSWREGVEPTLASTFGPAWLTELDSRFEESIVVEARQAP